MVEDQLPERLNPGVCVNFALKVREIDGCGPENPLGIKFVLGNNIFQIVNYKKPLLWEIVPFITRSGEVPNLLGKFPSYHCDPRSMVDDGEDWAKISHEPLSLAEKQKYIDAFPGDDEDTLRAKADKMMKYVTYYGYYWKFGCIGGYPAIDSNVNVFVGGDIRQDVKVVERTAVVEIWLDYLGSVAPIID